VVKERSNEGERKETEKKKKKKKTISPIHHRVSRGGGIIDRVTSICSFPPKEICRKRHASPKKNKSLKKKIEKEREIEKNIKYRLLILHPILSAQNHPMP
jgi:hypothetical protein